MVQLLRDMWLRVPFRTDLVREGLAEARMHSFIVFLFTLGAGFTISGLIAAVYGLSGFVPKTITGRIAEAAVLIFAGPTTYVANATTSLKKKECSTVAYLLVIAICGFWSFATGLIFLSVLVSLQA